MTNNIQGNSHQAISWFLSRNSTSQRALHDIFKVMKGKKLQPRILYPIRLSFRSDGEIKSLYFCFIDYAKAFDCVDHSKRWKILKEMGIPDHLTSLLRNLYAGQAAAVRTGYGKMDWFQIGKGICQGCILSPCLFNLYAEYIMWNNGLNEAQARIKIVRRNNNNLRYADDTTLNGRKLKGTEEPLDESKREEWKSWLKTQHSEN